VAAQLLDIPHPRFCLPPSDILHEQNKDDIVGKLLFAAKNDQLQSMTKEQFEDTFNLADNPRFQPYYKELKNFIINDKGLLCVKHPLLEVKGAGTRTKIVLPHWLAEVVARDVHKTEIHPGAQVLEMILAQRFWWPLMKETVEVTTSHCTLCKQIKHPKPETHSTLGQTTSQEQP
jgi:Integrase zinc binding domain